MKNFKTAGAGAIRLLRITLIEPLPQLRSTIRFFHLLILAPAEWRHIAVSFNAAGMSPVVLQGDHAVVPG